MSVESVAGGMSVTSTVTDPSVKPDESGKYRMPDSAMSHMFRVARRIEGEMTETTTLSELRGKCAMAAIYPKFRDVLYAGLTVEWAHMRGLSDVEAIASEEFDRLVSTYLMG